MSKARTSGSYVTKSGRKTYRGERKHWYVYFYDDDGKIRKRIISALEVPYYGSLIRRSKTYRCRVCGNKFRALKPKCPKCGSAGIRLERVEVRDRRSAAKSRVVKKSEARWSYQGTFEVEGATRDAPAGQSG